jgi:hypothetical protein
MKNKYLKNLNKIEFVVTSACTGRCKHCSQGDHASGGEHINYTIASDAVRKVASEYDIKTVMTFGGEPLLYPDAVCEIMSAARDMNVPRRQVITNGYFSKSKDEIRRVAEGLSMCGVNDLLLSVDVFHQETIPLEIVMDFASEAVRFGIPIRLQPAWLVNADDDNTYNIKTRQILGEFSALNIPTSDGNVIFPEGNAIRFLSEYFGDSVPKNPYVDNPFDVRCLSFSPNGDVLDGNVYSNDIMKIIESYNPER